MAQKSGSGSKRKPTAIVELVLGADGLPIQKKIPPNSAKAICPICFDNSGLAYVKPTKNYGMTLFCSRCGLRIFTYRSTPAVHLLLDWQRVLKDSTIRDTLMQLLTEQVERTAAKEAAEEQDA